MPKEHAISVVGKGHNYHARCICGWRSGGRPLRAEAVQEAGMHRLEIKYGRAKTETTLSPVKSGLTDR